MEFEKKKKGKNVNFLSDFNHFFFQVLGVEMLPCLSM